MVRSRSFLVPLALFATVVACGGGDDFETSTNSAGGSAGAAGSATAGSGTAGAGTAGSATAGSGTAGSATAGSGTAGTGTAGSATAGSGTAGSGTAGTATAGSATAGSGTAGSATAGSGTAGSVTAGSGTAGSGTAGSATAGSGTAGTAGSGTAGTGTAGAAGAPDCSPACAVGFTCCGGKCVNGNNDIKNCGQCGNACDGLHPFCNGGKCDVPPCEGTACIGTKFCCGTQCCGLDELCCEVPGPVSSGPKCQKPNEQGTCDMGCTQCQCDAPDTPIATPTGERPIASLREGDLVYTVHEGKIVARPVLRTHRVPAPRHVVVELVLATGRVLHVSGAHPTTDGRTFAGLRPGDALDGVRVAAARIVPFQHDTTHDILPDSDTGGYFAAGVLIGSTLRGSVHTGESRQPPAPMSVAR